MKKDFKFPLGMTEIGAGLFLLLTEEMASGWLLLASTSRHLFLEIGSLGGSGLVLCGAI